MGKAIWVDGVHQQQRQPGRRQPCEEFGVVQQTDLATRATESFHAMHTGGDDQQRVGLCRREQRGVNGKRLSGRPERIRVEMPLDAHPPGLGGRQELGARFIVGLGEEGFDGHLGPRDGGKTTVVRFGLSGPDQMQAIPASP